MLEFTSSLYLGLKHGSASIEPWDKLTTGAPAALTEPPGAAPVAQALASLMGCGRGLLLASTLHLFWDVFGGLGGSPVRIYWDAGLYPIARWGVERAAGRNARVRRFAHHDAGHLRRLLDQDASRKGRPAVVSDGFCPGCRRGSAAARVPRYCPRAGRRARPSTIPRPSGSSAGRRRAPPTAAGAVAPSADRGSKARTSWSAPRWPRASGCPWPCSRGGRDQICSSRGSARRACTAAPLPRP